MTRPKGSLGRMGSYRARATSESLLVNQATASVAAVGGSR